MSAPRSGKFYRKNEAEVMRDLGLEPTPNSGSGWIVKEDGQSEDVICQLKSTDKQSIGIKKIDIDTLEYNASIEHKIPVFAIQFLQSNQVYLLVKPEDIQNLSEYIKTGKAKASESDLIDWSGMEEIEDVKASKKGSKIRSSENAREAFHKERNKKFKKEKSAI